MTTTQDIPVLRYAAFSTSPDGGNRAGVVPDATGLGEREMRAVAAEVGYSETAFLTPADEVPPGLAPERAFTVRYFSPEAEVAFCGHATVATAVALGERLGAGPLHFASQAGPVPVDVAERGGALRATLSSVQPRSSPAHPADLAEALSALNWRQADLDPAIPPRIAFAGNDHLVLAAATRERLADLDYDFEALKVFMLRLGLTTVHLVWRESASVFHARDPFPVGGVVEDAATGAAAAAFGGEGCLVDQAGSGSGTWCRASQGGGRRAQRAAPTTDNAARRGARAREPGKVHKTPLCPGARAGRAGGYPHRQAGGGHGQAQPPHGRTAPRRPARARLRRGDPYRLTATHPGGT